MKKERKGREKKDGLDKYKIKCERKKKKKEEKEEGKKKNMDATEVKCAQVSLCGAARVEQKEVGSLKLWKSCFESESMVVKLLLVVILAVSMCMFGVAEHSLKNMILDNATWQDWYLSGRWQDWHLSKSDRDRRPSRKGLSKATGFRKRRHVRRRLALVGQVFKIMVFICMDTVHAMQHGPDTNPDLVANGPAGSAEAPSADQVLTQVLRQNTEALQKLALSGSGSEVSRNLESASRILKNPFTLVQEIAQKPSLDFGSTSFQTGSLLVMTVSEHFLKQQKAKAESQPWKTLQQKVKLCHASCTASSPVT